jgi:hypothetical protein
VRVPFGEQDNRYDCRCECQRNHYLVRNSDSAPVPIIGDRRWCVHLIVDPPDVNQHDPCQKSALSTNRLFIDADSSHLRRCLSANASDRARFAKQSIGSRQIAEKTFQEKRQ